MSRDQHMEGSRYYRFVGGPADGRMLVADLRCTKVTTSQSPKKSLAGRTDETVHLHATDGVTAGCP